MEHKYFNIIKNIKGLNPLIFIMFFITLQKVAGGMEKPTENNNNTNELEIAVQNNIIFHYDFSNLNSYNRQTTTENNKTINDLSGNNNYGTVRNISKVYFDSEQNAMFFNGKNDEDATGISINNLNYVSGPSDQLESLTIQARIKAKSESTNHPSDERIILSFDRSAVFFQKGCK